MPISNKCFHTLKQIITNKKHFNSIAINEYTNFVFLNRNGLSRIMRNYANVIGSLVSKHNKCHIKSLPHKTTPHTLRHLSVLK